MDDTDNLLPGQVVGTIASHGGYGRASATATSEMAREVSIRISGHGNSASFARRHTCLIIQIIRHSAMSCTLHSATPSQCSQETKVARLLWRCPRNWASKTSDVMEEVSVIDPIAQHGVNSAATSACCTHVHYTFPPCPSSPR